MKSLFETEALNEIRTRLGSLSENSEKQWGKMTSGQMMHHCQLPLNVILEKENYNLKPNWFVKTFFKKAMYSDKPWRKNLPTVKQFKETTPRDFTTEKQHLEQLLIEFEAQREREDWKPHPSFGELTKEQWGKMQYKHLDHHFRQFKV
ncbi:DUF1569 domain-containing protein [Rasiella sp. SM2506]|uniref:DUF1569 domain-containing protein n=1 Tax=Rasiella sp. SM2506 TaxID=3423914 RepID=UPI003D7AF567